MQKLGLYLTAGFLLLWTSCQRHSAETNAAFILDTSRAEVLSQLKASGAKILEDTDSRLVADLNRPRGRQKMQVSLAFEQGVLKSVQYLPQPDR